MITHALKTIGLYVLAIVVVASGAHAQTADQYNRASQAIQICSSAQGALIPECAKLRGAYGAPTFGGSSGLGGFGGGKAGAAAGILGAVMGAARQSQAPAAAPQGPAALNPQALQNAIAMCVRNAAGDAAAIQACLAIASTGSLPAPRSPAPTLAQSLYPATASGQNTALTIHQAGQDYHACVAANPNNWQACMQSSGLTGQQRR